jgi:hypothetical protein
MESNDVVTVVKREFTGLTNLPINCITGLCKEDGQYVVSLEAVEKRSIPDAMDLLGAYQVRLDSNGVLVSFERKKLRKRGDATES